MNAMIPMFSLSLEQRDWDFPAGHPPQTGWEPSEFSRIGRRAPREGDVSHGHLREERRARPAWVGDGDFIVHRPDGTQLIYSGAAGYREAVRDGAIARWTCVHVDRARAYATFW